MKSWGDKWKDFLLQGKPLCGSSPILESWKRSLEAGIDPLSCCSFPRLDAKEIERRFSANQHIIHIVEKWYATTVEEKVAFPFVVSFIDTEGFEIASFGSEEIRSRMRDVGVDVGICSREECVGTTGPSLCYSLRRPVIVHAEQHFLKSFQWASCVAVPLKSPSGLFFGLVNICTLATRISDQKDLFRLMNLAKRLVARVITEHCRSQEHDRIEIAKAFYQKELVESDVPMIIINKEGKIVDQNEAARRKWGKHGFAFLKDWELVRQVQAQNEVEVNGWQVRLLRKGGEPLYLLRKDYRREIISIKNEKATQSGARYTFADIIGESESLKKCITLAKRYAENDLPVLIEGETGTGKEMFAHAIHNSSNRRTGPFIAIDCSAIPENLAESELFGYERGAFTGALSTGSIGKIQLADGGTLFFDEIQAMSVNVQNKLLRFLETGEFYRIGGRKPVKVNVRIIAVSSVDLEEKGKKGEFLLPLYYRLNVCYLRLPSLRERVEDVVLLARHFLMRYGREWDISDEALNLLKRYEWPGNVRELRNAIDSAIVKAESTIIRPCDLPYKLLKRVEIKENWPRKFDEHVRMILIEAVKETGIVKEAAHRLEVPVSTLYRWLRKYGVTLKRKGSKREQENRKY